MKFNRLLLAILSIGVSLLLGCAHPAEKKVNPVGATSGETKEISSASAASILPVGPATPNPYLQNVQQYSDSVKITFHDAVAAMRQKNWSHAESALSSLAAANPSLSGVHLNLGIVYRELGNKEKAEEQFKLAIQTNLKNVDAYSHLALLKRESGNFAEAEKLYQKSLTIWPFYPDGHKNLAILYDLYLAQPEQALPHYLAYQQLLPAPDKQVESWIAELQRRMKSGKKIDKEEAK